MRNGTVRRDTPAAAAAAFDVAGARRALLGWYRRARRDLPWRRSRDPYRIWLAETMLQQTRVDVVVPYYERFLARFPDLDALARADLDAVLQAWAGLGYYSRARHLHAAAQRIQSESGSVFPADPAALATLPGVGRYTAGAVASIAFGARAPILDGNVRRVFARLLDFDGDVQRGPADGVFWELAGRWAACRSPGDANQALMELGALVCTPGVPHCDRCPLAERCAARRAGRQAALPRPRTRPRTVRVELTAAVVRRGDRLLLVRRRSGRLLRDWWELPVGRGVAAQTRLFDAPARSADIATLLGARLGVAVSEARSVGTFRHGILNNDLHVTVWTAAARRPRNPAQERVEVSARRRERDRAKSSPTPLANLDLESLEVRWVDEAERQQLPLSTLARKSLQLALREAS